MPRSEEDKISDLSHAAHNAITAVLARHYDYRRSFWHKAHDPKGPNVAQNLADWRRFVSRVKGAYEADARVIPMKTYTIENFDHLQSEKLGEFCNAIIEGTTDATQ